MKIPFVDLHAQYLSIKDEIDTAIATVIAESAYIRGRFVADFEKKYAEAYGVKNCVSCADGTSAIYIVLKMLGIGPGDEVITTANTWIASAETVSQCGARPIFVDVEEDFYNIDSTKIEAKITPRTKAIIAVHLMGQPAQIDKIKAICDTHNLLLIEDCAQAHFATYNEQRVGTFGVAGTFSFYPGKNLGAYGDAGAIITNDDDLAKRCKIFASHGASPINKHDHVMEGINSRMDGLQAAILLAKLPHIHDWTRKRQAIAKRYDELLSDNPNIIKTPIVRENASHVYHVYCVRVKNRNKVQAYLNANGVATSIHYPTALPFLEAYRYQENEASDFPLAWRNQHEMLSLPIFPEMTDEQIQYVAKTLSEAPSQ